MYDALSAIWCVLYESFVYDSAVPESHVDGIVKCVYGERIIGKRHR